MDLAPFDAANKKISAPDDKDAFENESLGTAIGKFAKDRGHQSILRIMQELNVNDLNRSRKNASSRMLNLSDGTALLFALDQRVYEADDDFVKGSEIRHVITQHLQKQYPEQPIRFIESAGVAEAGTGYYATVPVFSYFHFNYQRNNFITRQKRIDTFFNFAKTIGSVPDGDTSSQVVRMHTYKKLFSTQDDTKLTIDIFFNPAGIARMQAVSQEEIRPAFIKTLANYSPYLEGHPSLGQDITLKKQCELIFSSYQKNGHGKQALPHQRCKLQKNASRIQPNLR